MIISDFFTLIAEPLKGICLDLRPMSIVDRVKFDHVYFLLIQYKDELLTNNLVRHDFVWLFFYTSNSLLVQCNYSKHKEELISEWKRYNQTLLGLFDIEPELEITEQWIDQNIVIQDQKIDIYYFIKFLKYQYNLILQSDLITESNKYLRLGTLIKSEDRFLEKYWKLSRKFQNQVVH